MKTLSAGKILFWIAFIIVTIAIIISIVKGSESFNNSSCVGNNYDYVDYYSTKYPNYGETYYQPLDGNINFDQRNTTSLYTSLN